MSESKALRALEKENEKLQKRIEKLEALRDTVSINCNPPADCNNPKILKTYMKACFDQANKLCEDFEPIPEKEVKSDK